MQKFILSFNTSLFTISLLTLVAGTSPGAAQSLVSTATLPVGQNPYCVAVADVNGDGKPDLISVNQLDNTLTVLTNNGQGVFIPASTNAVGSQPTFVVAANVKGYGLPDLISANFGTDTLTVLTNNGDGAFTLSTTITVGPNPFNVVMVNVNGGATNDLVCANAGANTLTVLTNDGHGNFQLSQTLAVGSSLSSSPSVAAADLNGDGRLDLISANYNDDSLTVLTNDGHGTFIFSTNLPVGTSPASVVAADVNGDNKPDLICVNSGDNDMIVLTNNGGGTFTASTTNAVGLDPFWVAASDVNRDGKMDVITVNFGDEHDFTTPGTVTVLTNNGDGTFTSFSTNAVGLHPDFVGAADLNGDGVQDLVIANYDGANLTVLVDLPVLKVQATNNSAAFVSWPSLWPGYVLQQNTNLATGSWVNASNPTGTNHVVISPATRNYFFRLRHP